MQELEVKPTDGGGQGTWVRLMTALRGHKLLSCVGPRGVGAIGGGVSVRGHTRGCVRLTTGKKLGSQRRPPNSSCAAREGSMPQRTVSRACGPSVQSHPL